MLVVTGVLMTVFQLVVFPPVIKAVGVATWQRIGFVAGIPAFLAVPAVKMLSWNYPSLFAASVGANTLTLCSLGAVRSSIMPNTRRCSLPFFLCIAAFVT